MVIFCVLIDIKIITETKVSQKDGYYVKNLAEDRLLTVVVRGLDVRAVSMAVLTETKKGQDAASSLHRHDPRDL